MSEIAIFRISQYTLTGCAPVSRNVLSVLGSLNDLPGPQAQGADLSMHRAGSEGMFEGGTRGSVCLGAEDRSGVGVTVRVVGSATGFILNAQDTLGEGVYLACIGGKQGAGWQ